MCVDQKGPAPRIEVGLRDERLKRLVWKVAWHWRKLVKVPEIGQDEAVAEAWFRIWSYWDSIAASPDWVLSLKKQVKWGVLQLAIKHTGRWVNARGKRRWWSGTRRHVAYSVISDAWSENRGMDDSEFQVENWARWKPHGRGALPPPEAAIVREEVALAGSALDVLRKYGDRSYLRDPHFR